MVAAGRGGGFATGNGPRGSIPEQRKAGWLVNTNEQNSSIPLSCRMRFAPLSLRTAPACVACPRRLPGFSFPRAPKQRILSGRTPPCHRRLGHSSHIVLQHRSFSLLLALSSASQLVTHPQNAVRRRLPCGIANSSSEVSLASLSSSSSDPRGGGPWDPPCHPLT